MMSNRKFSPRLSLLAFGAAVGFCAFAGPALANPKIITIDPASSIATYAWSLNDKGVITGFYYDGAGGSTKGFVRKLDGTITTFDHATSEVTAAYGIDAKNRVTGYWSTDDGNFPGFIRSPKGTLKYFWADGSVTGTFPVAMNATGVITGSYYDTYDVPHGFVRTPDGKSKSFDVKNDAYGTSPAAINGAD